MNEIHKLKICPIDYTMNVIGGKWKIKILYQIYIGKIIRYGQIKKILSTITHKMLSQQLKELEKDDLIYRTEYPQIPPRVEYKLSPRGKSLLPVLKLLTEWGEENQKMV